LPLLSAVKALPDCTQVLSKATSQGILSALQEQVAAATSLVWFLLARCQECQPRGQGPPMTAERGKGVMSSKPVVQIVLVHRLLGQRMGYLEQGFEGG